MVWGRVVSSPSRVRGGAPAAIAFSEYFRPQKASGTKKNTILFAKVYISTFKSGGGKSPSSHTKLRLFVSSDVSDDHFTLESAAKAYAFAWASAHKGKWGQLTPLENGWKIKKRKHTKESSFLCLCYILRAIMVGRCRERLYADHICWPQLSWNQVQQCCAVVYLLFALCAYINSNVNNAHCVVRCVFSFKLHI